MRWTSTGIVSSAPACRWPGDTLTSAEHGNGALTPRRGQSGAAAPGARKRSAALALLMKANKRSNSAFSRPPSSAPSGTAPPLARRARRLWPQNVKVQTALVVTAVDPNGRLQAARHRRCAVGRATPPAPFRHLGMPGALVERVVGGPPPASGPPDQVVDLDVGEGTWSGLKLMIRRENRNPDNPRLRLRASSPSRRERSEVSETYSK